MILREQDIRDIAEIMRLHDEAFERYQKCPGASWKSSEGAVSVHFGTYWDRNDEAGSLAVSIDVYSYALGPSRNHYFKTIPQALEAVRGWHRSAFAHECSEWC